MKTSLGVGLSNYTSIINYSDLETIGLYEDLNSPDDFWCLCSLVDDPETGEEVVLLFHDRPEWDGVSVIDPYDGQTYIIPERVGSLVDGVRYWYKIGQDKGTLSVHNCFTYDKPVLEKIWPKCVIPNECWHDTFVQSKVQWFERPQKKGAGVKSPHGLANYAVMKGIHKPPITDWKTMDPMKLHRCVEDVRIQKYCHQYLQKEFDIIKDRLGIDFTEAYERECRYARRCSRQEIRGILVDEDHIKTNIKRLDVITEDLARIIEPKLPPTVKAKGTKATKADVIKALGYTMQVPVDYDAEGKPIKEYYKPTVKFTKIDNVTKYEAFNISYGTSPTYSKRNELLAWIKENHPETKTSEWDIDKTIVEGVVLNANTCKYFELEETDTHIIVGPHTKVEFNPSRMTQHDVVKGYLISLGWRHPEEWNLKKDSKTKQIIRADRDTWVVYPKKAHPRNQVRVLCKKGQPLYTTPKLTEDDYKQLPEGIGTQIAEYNTYMHRRRFLSNPKDPEEKGLLAAIRDRDGRVGAGVNNFGTATGRSSHRVWVNAPGGKALFAKEIRSCLIAPDGRKFVSCDMNSAQLSIAAYYANNYDYFQAVCFGEEFKVDDKGNEIMHPDTGKPWYIGESGHCVNAISFGLFTEEEKQEAVRTQNQKLIQRLGYIRKDGKAGSFGTIFGCSGKKLASMLKVVDSMGEVMKKNFLSRIGLDRVIAICENMAKDHARAGGGYIELPFGYYVHCRQPHKYFNYLDQGTEAVCQKIAELYFEEEAEKRNMDAYIVLSYHDEFTVEAADKDVDASKELMFESYKYASEQLWEWHKTKSKYFVGNDCPKFHIHLESGAKVGSSYWGVH